MLTVWRMRPLPPRFRPTLGLTLLASCLERWLICGLYVSVGTYFLGGEGAR